ncbi:YggS family pyridoxal phosphate-dependent enzyme [Desulfopila inferna]|uniref:YggS family pyridoxal phosphate-dependent enzyme n=1 Tax=Desulfopila inferna TaxID=468528 RepID=UPI0019656AF8|nr:YggS family pyridoxal phosphate-dependent enzyme [Desulfopila inferna]MBM9604232.1 YggS family pyridoxal phosphate-dependent enzyme [Desulfopila inferna]
MIAENLEHLKKSIAQIARNCGRDENSVRLVAVSKRFPPEAVIEAKNAGQLLFGENYIQEAQEKFDLIGNAVQFHFIGHLQSNKAKIAAELFAMVETVDRIKLAAALNKHLLALDRTLDVLVQVNIGKDDNKSGVQPEDAEKLVQEIGRLPKLRVRGLMTMPPFTENPEDARPYFRNLKRLADSMAEKSLFYDNKNIELSMGMTHDYPIAIEEGATLVRIGTAIFGERPTKV